MLAFASAIALWLASITPPRSVAEPGPESTPTAPTPLVPPVDQDEPGPTLAPFSVRDEPGFRVAAFDEETGEDVLDAVVERVSESGLPWANAGCDALGNGHAWCPDSGRPTTVSVAAPGYWTASRTWRTADGPIAQVGLRRAAMVRGRVESDAGAPIEGATVLALASYGAQGLWSRGEPATRTAADGTFELPLNRNPGFRRGSAGIAIGAVHADFAASVTRIELPEQGRDLEGVAIVLRAGCVAEGRVVDASGRGLPHAPVSVTQPSAEGPWHPSEETRAFDVLTNAAGQFRFEHVACGAARFSALPWPRHGTADAQLVRNATTRVEIRVVAAPTVSGRVELPDGRPAAAVVQVFRASESFVAQQSVDVVLSDDDGAFHAENVPDRMRLYARARPLAAAADARAGDRGVLLRLRPAGSIEIVPSLDGDEVPWPLDVSASLEADRIRSECVSAPCVLNGVLPGRWVVTAQQRGRRPVSVRDVSVSEGEVTRVHVELPRVLRVRGRVVDEQGRGVFRARVVMAALNGGVLAFDVEESVVTDAAGAFELRRNAGDGGIRVSRGGYRTSTRTVLVREADLELGEIVLEKGDSRTAPEAYVGIGIQWKANSSLPEVGVVIPGGPAERAGIRVEDRLLAIDDVPTAGLELGSVAGRIRGVPGTRVKLDIQRGDRRLEYTLVRELIVDEAE